MSGPAIDLVAHGAEAGGTLAGTALLVGPAAAVAAAYEAGVRRLLPTGPPSWRWRRWSFHLGLVVLVTVLLPVVEPVVEESFPAHMAQHIALLLVAGPLLAAGQPGLPLLLALPHPWRRRVAAVRSSRSARRVRAAVTVPAVVVAVHAAVVAAWHLPSVYAAALSSTAVHVTEHACFLAVGWWLWAAVSTSSRQQLDGRTVLYVVASGLPMNLLGAVLVFAPEPLYPEQTGTGTGALAEQQLAGLLMWVPAGMAYLLLCTVLVLVWLRRMERDAPGGVPLPPPTLDALPVPARSGRPIDAEVRR
ncbi:cytochrome c oxidase assembly protein [Blastococcus tunisiensis]|uniref:Cytochrome c oxidase assembly factor CtaG n=1 Tax=Blastococcus tunisiensis TaxID=1798228 RepID=A0A1I2DSJ9_9ACTN|nr:cytochrome c oxidase assembly protein [Blastococcus sp. DSM 46838]SFE83241.1 Cytochrome c oxidase assembly factor CtaG [Blastococcus sp. DSM 46838]